LFGNLLDTWDTVTVGCSAAHLAEEFITYIYNSVGKTRSGGENGTTYIGINDIAVASTSGGQEIEPYHIHFVPSLIFSEISERRWVKCFQKFPKGEGVENIRKFTHQGTCSRIHSE
jgi:hypothetical protein